MTEDETRIADCLNRHATRVECAPTSLLPGIHARSRALARRRNTFVAVGAAAAVPAMTVAGFGAASSLRGSAHTPEVVVMGAASSTASQEPSPIPMDAPHCPSGELPNLVTDEAHPVSTEVRTDDQLVALARADGHDAIGLRGVFPGQQEFLVNGATPHERMTWILAFDTPDPTPAASYVVGTSDGSPWTVWDARFAGCEATP